MIKKKAITVLTLSVIMSTAIGFSAPHKIAYAASNNQADMYVDEDLVSKENATLVFLKCLT